MPLFNMRWKIRAIAQMPAPSDHGQIDTGTTALHFDSQDVDIGIGHGVNGLLMQHARQCCHLIPHLGCQFKFKSISVRHHAVFHRLQNRLRFAA